MYKKACILVAQGVQDEEFIYPYYRLKEDFDLDVIFVGTEKYNQPIGKYGIPFKPTVYLNEQIKYWEEVDYTTSEKMFTEFVNQYDIVIIPGGWQCPEILRMNKHVKKFVLYADKNKAIIGAICHGPQVLISSEVGQGMRMTGFAGIWDDIENFGAILSESEVVKDKNIITAQHYKNNPEFMKTIIDQYFNVVVPQKYQG